MIIIKSLFCNACAACFAPIDPTTPTLYFSVSCIIPFALEVVAIGALIFFDSCIISFVAFLAPQPANSMIFLFESINFTAFWKGVEIQE
jgi:hypothetical protein